ncbi:MAG: DNA starvation/stationary phase protection protein Dps [Myxococcota bacterium]|nr:DNA starvation/stationary phase protection protein Dps [Myxococcota bacterium]
MATRFPSHVNLNDDVRSELVELLNDTLATSIDLTYQVKQAHWNIKGPWFFARHELFDKLAGNLREWTDDIAERASTLGGYAKGTVRMAAGTSKLGEYDERVIEGKQHIRALVDRYTTFTQQLRDGIATAQKKEDVVTEDLLTEVARGAELDMWFLESHIAM